MRRTAAAAVGTALLASCDCRPGGATVISPVSSAVTTTTAELGGTILNQGTSPVDYKGVVFSPISLNPIPTRDGRWAETVEIHGPFENGEGSFTLPVEGLEPGTQYAFRAYAVSLHGASTCYSTVGTFTTRPLAGTGDTAFAAPAVDAEADNGSIRLVAMQPDGRVLIAGDFTRVAGQPRPGLARLLPDGSLDPSFIPGPQAGITAMALLPDGRIVVAHSSVVRLRSDGSEDALLLGPGRVFAPCTCLAVQPDGRLIAAGRFLDDDSADLRELLRFDASGALEPAALFSPNGASSVNGSVLWVTVQQDGKILIGGDFTSVAGSPRTDIARLLPDGTLEGGAAFDPGASTGAGPGRIRFIGQQTDGKLLIWGDFTTFNGSTRQNFARLLTTGAVDSAYVPPSVPRTPGAVALQSDGRLVLGGAGTLERLTSSGGADSSLDAAVSGVLDERVIQMAALRDNGDVYAGGSVAPPSVRPLVRVLSSGGVDDLSATSPSRVQWLRSGALPEVSQVVFEQSVDQGATWTVLGLASPIVGGGGWERSGLSLPGQCLLRARGRTVSAGSYRPTPSVTIYTSASGIVEKRADITTSGPPLIGSPAIVSVAAETASLQAGVTYAGGSAITSRGVVVALMSGTLYPETGGSGVMTFTAAGSTGQFTAAAAGLLPGRRYVFRGFATNSQGTAYTAPLAFDTWDRPAVHSPSVTAVTANSARLGGSIGSDGGTPVYERGVIYAAGASRLMSNTGVTRVVISGTGSPFSTVVSGLAPATTYAFTAYAVNITGTSYSPVAQFTTGGGTPPPPADTAQTLALQPDGRMIVGGQFNVLGGTARRSLARLQPDGTVDNSFTATTDGSVYSAAVQPDGKIVIGGAFQTVNGEPRNFLARLNADGSLESGSAWLAGAGPNQPVSCIALQTDGRILIGGSFTSVNNRGRNRIARLRPDGGVEDNATFNTGTGADDSVFTLAVQNDGRILAGGAFLNFNGQPRTRLVRLSGDGTLESTAAFNPGSGPDGWVHCLAVQPDGKILAGGDFTSVDGQSRRRLARLHGDGQVESTATFNIGTGAPDRVYSIALQADGRIIAGGGFQEWNGAPRSRFVRLLPNGAEDAGLSSVPGASDTVDGVALLPDGAVQLAGAFSSVNGAAAALTARLTNPAPAAQSLSLEGTTARWLRSGSAPEVTQPVFEVSTDGKTWSAVPGARISGGWQASGIVPPGSNWQLRASGRTTGGFLNAGSGLAVSVLRFGSDSDNDGLPDVWEIAAFGTTAGHSALDDYDGDGQVELQELAFGSNPLQPDNGAPPVTVENGFLTVTIIRHAGVDYTVETAPAPAGPWSSATTTVVFSDAATLKVRDTVSSTEANRRFLRVRVSAAP